MAVNPLNYYMKFRRAYRLLDDVVNGIEAEMTRVEEDKPKAKIINEIIEDSISKSEDILNE